MKFGTQQQIWSSVTGDQIWNLPKFCEKLLPHAKFHRNRAMQLHGEKWFSIWLLSAILNLKKIYVTVTELQICCYNTTHRDLMIFRLECDFTISKWLISAILIFRGTDFLKSPCRTSYRSPIETITLNCLVIQKIVFLCTHFGDSQTNERTNRWTVPMRKAASSLSRAAA